MSAEPTPIANRWVRIDPVEYPDRVEAESGESPAVLLWHASKDCRRARRPVEEQPSVERCLTELWPCKACLAAH